MGEDHLWLLEIGESDEQSLGPMHGRHEEGIKRTEVKTEKLEKALQRFTYQVSKMLTHLETKCGDYQLDEVEIKADISSTGGITICMVGNVEFQTGGGVTLKYKRKPTNT